jgi:hypothetical protein
MDQTPQKPSKRRRWLIVAFVLVLVLGPLGIWWYLPKIDEDRVGTWTVTQGNSPDRSLGPLQLKSDGTGLMVVRILKDGSPITRTSSFEWRVMGGNFVILGPNNSGFPLWDRAMGRPTLIQGVRSFLATNGSRSIATTTAEFT